MAGRPAGAPNLRDTEITAIIDGVKRRLPRVQSKDIGMMRVYELVSEETGFDSKTVGRVWRMLQPTTGLAVDFIKARAFRMARKIVNEASVPDMIDILSRPNIGVLEPIKKVEGGAGGGFFLSVAMDSCGGVQVSAAAGVQPQPLAPTPTPLSLPPAEAPVEADIIEETGVEEEKCNDYTLPAAPDVDPHARHRPRAPGNSKAYEDALAAAKIRIAKRAKMAESQRKYRAKKAGQE
jgi:hypothetical protein